MSEPLSTSDSASAAARLRLGAYLLLSAISLGQMTGRLLALNSLDRPPFDAARVNEQLAKDRKELAAKGLTGDALNAQVNTRRHELQREFANDRPFFSSNDRSRWATIRCLVEYGTYEIDKVVTDPHEARTWDTIDMVKHRGRDGQGHLYSSKPPLLATLLAGEYWAIYHATGLTLRDNAFVVVRIMLFLSNIIPLGIYFLLLAMVVERYGTTNWGRLLVMSTATFGTFITTFAVALNNHVTAAICVMAALYAALRIWNDGRRELRYFAVAGLFSAFAATMELPALSFCVLLGAALAWRAARPTLLVFVPAALIVSAAFFGTNWLANDTLGVAYGYRDPTKNWESGNWYNYTFQVGKATKQSYWSVDEASLRRRSAIDRGEASRATYALHVLVGHHGIFSLTPIWLLSLAGVLMLVCGRAGAAGPSLRAVGVFVAVLTLVCLAFYLGQGKENRNYGGGTSGLRWVFWLIPMWLLAMLPAADWTEGRRWRQVLAAVLLGLSAMSVAYPVWTPWAHPWLAQWMAQLGWIKL